MQNAPTTSVQFRLPDETPLTFDLTVEAHMNAAFGGEVGWIERISTTHQAYVFLFMCANPKQKGEPALWEAMGRAPSGEMLPLYLRIGDLIGAALEWFSERFKRGDAPGFIIFSNYMWVGGEPAIDASFIAQGKFKLPNPPASGNN